MAISPRQNASPDTAGHRLILGPFASSRPMLGSCWASPCQSTASKAQDPDRTHTILRLKSLCEKERLARAAPSEHANLWGFGFRIERDQLLGRAPGPEGVRILGLVLGPSWFILSLGVRFRGHQAGPGFSPQLFFFTFSSGSGLAIPAFAVVSARADGPAASGAEGPGTGHLRWAEGGSWPAPQTCRRQN